MRTPRHKLMRKFHWVSGNWSQLPADISAPSRNYPVWPVERSDLVADPLEVNNVADNPASADIRRDLSDRLWGWLEAMDDPILRGPLETPFYRQAIADYRS